MAEEEKVLRGESALKLARQGKEVWNAWIAKHDEWRVDFSNVRFTTRETSSIGFEGFRFPDWTKFENARFGPNADFKEAEFGEHADFSGSSFGTRAWFVGATFGNEANLGYAMFNDRVYFGGARFGDNASFEGTKFGDDVRFFRAKFGAGTSFDGTVFGGSVRFLYANFGPGATLQSASFAGPLDLEGTHFQSVPDLLYSKIERHVSLSKIVVDYDGEQIFRAFERAASFDNADKYRRLKELAVQSKDHTQELNFFADELRAMRWHSVTGFPLVLSYLYEWLSDFGRSAWRPSAGLFGTLAVFAGFHMLSATKAASWASALLYSASHLVPFLSGARDSKALESTTLYGDTVPHLIQGLNLFEGVLGLVFIFLIGLALRNRFRI